MSVPVRIFVGNVCTALQWNASSIYVEGNQVSHDGHLWEAKWWTQNEDPGSTGQWGVWEDLGTCGNSSTNVPPVVSISAPVVGAVFDEGYDVSIAVMANDDDGSIVQVEFFDGAVSLGIDASEPFGLTLVGIQEGEHILTVIATDDDGAQTTSGAVVISVNPFSSNIPPTASITSPLEGTTFDEGEDIIILVDAQDSDGVVTQVLFFLDENLVGTAPVAPWTFTLAGLEPGSHIFHVQAMDNEGKTGDSQAVRIIVSGMCPALPWNASTVYIAGDQVSHEGHLWEAKWWTQNEDPGSTGQWGVWMDLGLCQVSSNMPPEVTITSPVTGALFDAGDDVTISASATDPDGSVVQVAFFDGTVSFGAVTSAPFTLTLTDVQEGVYRLTAVATDNGGVAGISQTVEIVVGDVCSEPQWSASSIYVAGNQVSYNGHSWEAKWWTRADEPGTTGQWGVWMDLGTCGGGL